MPPKYVLFAQEARQVLLQGVNLLANAVKLTLGPMGRNVMLERGFGAQMVKAVAEKTSEMAGDGTTTATVLAQAVLQEGLKYIAADMDPMDLKRGIDKATASGVRGLERISMPCQDTKAITQIATTSADADESVGRLIADAMETVGREGVITIEDSTSIEDRIDYVDGMHFDRGYLSAFFVNQQDSLSVRLEEPLILLVAGKCSQVSELLPLLGSVAESGKPLLLIAEDFASEVLALFVINSLRGVIRVAAVKAPGFGDQRNDILTDIGIVTGGTVITKSTGLSLDKATLEDLGTARQVLILKDRTTIIDGGGKSKAIDDRSSAIRQLTHAATSDYDREKLASRMRCTRRVPPPRKAQATLAITPLSSNLGISWIWVSSIRRRLPGWRCKTPYQLPDSC